MELGSVLSPARIKEQTIYQWKKTYGAIKRGAAIPLKALEEENTYLTMPVAGPMLPQSIAYIAIDAPCHSG